MPGETRGQHGHVGRLWFARADRGDWQFRESDEAAKTSKPEAGNWLEI